MASKNLADIETQRKYGVFAGRTGSNTDRQRLNAIRLVAAVIITSAGNGISETAAGTAPNGT